MVSLPELLPESSAESLPQAASTRAPAAMMAISFFFMALLEVGRSTVAGFGSPVWPRTIDVQSRCVRGSRATVTRYVPPAAISTENSHTAPFSSIAVQGNVVPAF